MASRVPNESARLAALRRLAILDSAHEQTFDDIASLAAQICQTPIALISFLDQDRQWVKAAHGIAVRQMLREMSFCSRTIAQQDLDAILHVPDARLDPRFKTHPLVTKPQGIRFYAGISLVTADAMPVGTLCVVDRKPGLLDETQLQTLRVLARAIIAHLEGRLVKMATVAKTTDSAAQPIDAESLLRRYNGHGQVAEYLLQEFQEHIGAQLESLRHELLKRDAQSLARLAHSIEGTASDLSAEPLRESAHALETSILANDFETAAVRLTELESEARDVFNYLPTAAATLKRTPGNQGG